MILQTVVLFPNVIEIGGIIQCRSGHDGSMHLLEMSLSAAESTNLTLGLVAAIQSGQRSAFEALYRRHHRRIYALCLRMSGDRAAAEDYTQETFIRSWQRLESFDLGTNFDAWLMKVAVNVVRGGIRSSRRRVVREERVAIDQSGDHPDMHPELGHELERALIKLPDGQREVFVLHDVEGFKHQEIADMLGLKVGTSRSRLHQARKFMREQLR